MVLLQSSEEWQRQSSLLLQARPTTTRISINYKVPNLSSPKYQKALNRKRRKTADDAPSEVAAPLVPKAMLCLKTFDPESGVCLKFQTDRAAEVGRLVNGLGKLGKHMAALPLKTEDAIMEDAPPELEAAGDKASMTAPATTASIAQDGKGQQAQGGSGGGGGGKKKKKGKK